MASMFPSRWKCANMRPISQALVKSKHRCPVHGNFSQSERVIDCLRSAIFCEESSRFHSRRTITFSPEEFLMSSPLSSLAQTIPASYRTQGFDAEIELLVACSTTGSSISSGGSSASQRLTASSPIGSSWTSTDGSSC